MLIGTCCLSKTCPIKKCDVLTSKINKKLFMPAIFAPPYFYFWYSKLIIKALISDGLLISNGFRF